MDGKAVEQLVGLSRKPQDINGFIAMPGDWALHDPAALVRPGPTARTLAVSTLGAVRDYLEANRDRLLLDTIVVHVDGPSLVSVSSMLRERSRDREVYVSAKALDLTEGFLGRFMSLEDFIVGLQIRFADADDRKRILALLSNVKHETVKTALDDGVTQVLQARAGVALVSDVAVPNPVLLCAYRTFRDVVQPSSLFVLRVASGKPGGFPEVGLFEADGGAWRVGLFEADGGAWRLSAVERVREWLVDAVPAGVAVLA